MTHRSIGEFITRDRWTVRNSIEKFTQSTRLRFARPLFEIFLSTKLFEVFDEQLCNVLCDRKSTRMCGCIEFSANRIGKLKSK